MEDVTNTPVASAAPETPAATPEHAEQPGSVSSTSESTQAGQSKPPTTPVTTGKPEIDYRKRYDDLQREFTRRTQHEREVTNRLAAMEESFQKQAELLSRATEAPFNPEQFKQDWETKGPQALDSYYQKREQVLQQKYDKQISDMQAQMMEDRISLNLALRRGDDETYPDFESLEPVMNEIASSENCPVDLTRPISEVLDALYKLAREQHSVDAIKEAEKLGAAAKEKELAKEAATAVAGGGKTGGAIPTDPKKMSGAQLRQVFIDKGMVEGY